MSEKKWTPESLSGREYVVWGEQCILACEKAGIRDPETTIPAMVEVLKLCRDELRENVEFEGRLSSFVIAIREIDSVLATLNDESEVGDD